MTAVISLHIFFPKAGVYGMNIFAMLQLGLLIFIVVTGWVIMALHGPKSDFGHAFEGSVSAPSAYATAIFKALDAFDGHVLLPNLLSVNHILTREQMGECHVRTQRSQEPSTHHQDCRPPRSLQLRHLVHLGKCIILCCFYRRRGGQQRRHRGFVLHADRIWSLGGQGNEIYNLPFKNETRTHVPLNSVMVALSALGNVINLTFAQSRLIQEFAKEGVLPFSRF